MHADGAEHADGRLAATFARRLEARFGLPVALVDERLTSAEAAASLRCDDAACARRDAQDAKRRRSSPRSIILQSYLDDAEPMSRRAA